MQSHLLDEASKVIPNQQVLVNVISRRVRQLVQGHRPLVVVDSARMGHCDIALTEVIEHKLSYEFVLAPGTEATVPDVVQVPAFVPKTLAA